MKKILLTFLFLNILSGGLSAQDKKFKQKDKQFNDWSISAFGGGNLLQNTDLVSWEKGYFMPGFDLQFQVNKQITHAFGLSLQFQYGKTRQKGHISDMYLTGYDGWAKGRTEYYGLTLLGDLNISNLWRRVDNQSEFNWSLHAYAGVGILGYDAQRDNVHGSGNSNYVTIDKEKFGDKSMFAQVGGGIRHKLSRRIDVELRAMYVMTGDEEFDASGMPFPGQWTAADREEGRDDNMIVTSLGIHYKFGKHKEALQWHAPTIAVAAAKTQPVFECLDEDNDGVCDQWDKCPGTPEGIRVDGSGCPLDSDGDGVPDSIDKCPTIPGAPTNSGCPEKLVQISGDEVAMMINTALEGIEFDYDSDRIREASYAKLNNAAEVLKANPTYRYHVEGHTDAAGGVEYNQKLSERRAASVIRYLANKGVDTSRLVAIGKGKSDLKWVECNPVGNCPPWKNLENRRVIFKEIK